MERQIIVLETGGKNEDAYLVKVVLSETTAEAEQFCKDNTDTETKYWRYCEIINEGVTYEISRYENHIH